MTFELSPVQLFTICAIINGFVFSILLLEKSENRKANRYLSLMILSLCFTFTPYMLDTAIWHKFRWLAWLPFSLSYWIGPAFYFYVKTLTQPLIKFHKKNLWHFTPIILNYLHSIYHALVGNSNPFPWFHHAAEILESTAIISILVYMFICYRIITNYQQLLLDCVSNLDPLDLRWIKRFIIVLVISFIGILLFLIVSSGFFGKESFYKWDDLRATVLFLYSIILYWLSINGYKQAQTITIPIYTISANPEEKKYNIIAQLKSKMHDEKLYRNPELSLADLSKSIGISERVISETINGELQKNYYQFINEYRVEEMKERLINPNFSHLKIISLALEVGFNSKASFNRVFKSYTGLTPQQFKSKNS